MALIPAGTQPDLHILALSAQRLFFSIHDTQRAFGTKWRISFLIIPWLHSCVAAIYSVGHATQTKRHN